MAMTRAAWVVLAVVAAVVLVAGVAWYMNSDKNDGYGSGDSSQGGSDQPPVYVPPEGSMPQPTGGAAPPQGGGGAGGGYGY
jgi:hypothetical protein